MFFLSCTGKAGFELVAALQHLRSVVPLLPLKFFNKPSQTLKRVQRADSDVIGSFGEYSGQFVGVLRRVWCYMVYSERRDRL